MPNPESTRRYQRVALRVPVDVETIDPELDPRTGRPYFRTCQEQCGNLSTGGMFIHTAEPPTPGRRLLVRFHTADGLAVETVARVAWRGRGNGPGPSETGVGVEFIDASAATRAALERIVESSPEDRGD